MKKNLSLLTSTVRRSLSVSVKLSAVCMLAISSASLMGMHETYVRPVDNGKQAEPTQFEAAKAQNAATQPSFGQRFQSAIGYNSKAGQTIAAKAPAEGVNLTDNAQSQPSSVESGWNFTTAGRSLYEAMPDVSGRLGYEKPIELNRSDANNNSYMETFVADRSIETTDANGNPVSIDINENGDRLTTTFQKDNINNHSTTFEAAQWLNLPSRTASYLYSKLPTLRTPSMKINFSKESISNWLRLNRSKDQAATETQDPVVTKAVNKVAQEGATEIQSNWSLSQFSAFLGRQGQKLANIFRTVDAKQVETNPIVTATQPPVPTRAPSSVNQDALTDLPE